MIRSLVAAYAAWYLRHHGVRCASRQLEKVAVGVHLTPSEWEDVEGDAQTVAGHVRAADREMAWANVSAIRHLSHGNGAGDDLALRELARHTGQTPDAWLDATRGAL